MHIILLYEKNTIEVPCNMYKKAIFQKNNIIQILTPAVYIEQLWTDLGMPNP